MTKAKGSGNVPRPDQSHCGSSGPRAGSNNAAMAGGTSRLADLLEAEAGRSTDQGTHVEPSRVPHLVTGWSENWNSCLDDNAPRRVEEGWILVREPQLSWAWQWVQTALRVIPVEWRKQGSLLFAAVALAISEGEGLTRAREWWSGLRLLVSSGRRVELRAGGYVV